MPDPDLLRPHRDALHVGHPEAAGWVLGALDAGDAERFKRHLRSCRECQSAVTELEPVTRMLRQAAPVAEPAADGVPPADLQARTLASVERAARRAAVSR